MRLGTIVLVYLALAMIWISMAGIMEARHQRINEKLRADVYNLWGSHHRQATPRLSDGHRLDSAELKVKLGLDYRRKGHYWYSTYTAHFTGKYSLPSVAGKSEFLFPLPAGSGMFSDFKIEIGGKEIPYDLTDNLVKISLPPGASQVLVTYTGRGSDEWWYSFEDSKTAPRNLDLLLETDFGGFDFPDGAISPDVREAAEGGWRMRWTYKNLLSGGNIGLEMPHKSDDGPGLIDICRYGPLGLLLFFGAVTVCSIADQKFPHPMHYSFLGAGFFSFHLMLAYLGDVLSLPVSFALSALVAVFITFSYGSRVLGSDFARRRLLPALLLYLVVFSSSFLIEGYTGLPLVFLLVLTLHALMQITAKVDWSRWDSRNTEAEGGSSEILA